MGATVKVSAHFLCPEPRQTDKPKRQFCPRRSFHLL
jgi:hypothetical protein